MNKWNRLLAMLDQVYGFENRVKSNFKKVRQYFDEKANEHVFVIEYRVMKGNKVKQAGGGIAVGSLIRKIHEQSKGSEYPS